MSGARAAARRSGAPGLDVEAIRAQFPALDQEVHGRPLIYLDNAATTQKPRAVLDAMRDFYEHDCSNVHRGVHELSVRATERFESARRRVARFLGASSERECVFVRGATEAINLAAQSWARPRLGAGDRVLLTHMEHHSNIVPWQMVCQQTGAELDVAPISDDGALDLDALRERIGPRTRVVAVTHVSNALGTVNPVRAIADAAHEAGAVLVVDGAQAAPHLPVGVQELGADFYAVSGHKMYGPNGIGVLWARGEHLEEMPPWQGGGDMIRSVTFEKTLYNDVPFKFEAGTPNVAGAVGLGAAAEWLDGVGLEAIATHEHDLLLRATELLLGEEGVRPIGTAPEKAAVLSFVLEGVHPHDAGSVLDRAGVAVRTGHHCAQPAMQRFGVPATIRASFGAYNTFAEVEALAAGVHETMDLLG